MLLVVLISQALAVAVIVTISPAPPATIRLDDLAAAIRTGEGSVVQVRSHPETPTFEMGERQAAGLAARELAGLLGRPVEAVVVDLAPEQEGQRVQLVDSGGSERFQTALVGAFRVYVAGENGLWTEYRPARAPLGSWEAELVALFLAAALLIAPLAWWFARTLARPFTQLAEKAEQIGRNPQAVVGAVEGPAEAERVQLALAGMQDRLAATMEGRTQILAGIAHDLRTPLTRLVFRAEAMPEPTRSAFISDLAEMDGMMASAIDFARDTAASAPRQQLELGSLVEQVVESEAVRGQRPTLSIEGPLLVEADAVALRRLFANLVNNALVHGGSAEVSARVEGRMARVEIADRGPGMAEEDRLRAFEPFFRASSAPGGSGLGLAVVQAIAMAHGGEIRLENRPGGGMVASVLLPLSVAASRFSRDPA